MKLRGLICLVFLLPGLMAKLPSPVPSATPTVTTPSPTPGMLIQLTYITSSCQVQFDCMYAILVGCLEAEQPCLGEAQLLFTIPIYGTGPTIPVLDYSWSPDGQRIALDAPGLRGRGDVFIGDWAGKNWANLTHTPVYEGHPTWSPDGLLISYTANSGDPDHFSHAFSVRPDGTEISQLMSTLDFVSVYSLIWFPDGERVAFSHPDGMGDVQIFITRPDGSNLLQITRKSTHHGLSSISPDGKWLLFTAMTDSDIATSNIFLISTEDNRIVAVTEESQGDRYSPVWSPRGDWIAFMAHIAGTKDIYLIRPDGSGLINVTQSMEDEHAPAWRVVAP